jgi:hypothetical protein
MQIPALDHVARGERLTGSAVRRYRLAQGVVSHLSLGNDSELRASTRVKMFSGIPDSKTAPIP